MNLEPDFGDFLAALIKNEVEFVIVGAFALAHHGAPRATGDFDVWVRPTRTNAKAVLRALGDFGAPLTGLSEDDFLIGQIVQIGVVPVRIDVINELSGVSAEEVWSEREKGVIGPHQVHFIGRKTYIKNKRASGRAKDLADLESLGEPPAK